MADINALYPQPPAQAQNILTDPSKALGLLGQVNALTLQGQQIRANQGVEDLYKGAIGPDGTPDNALVMSRAPATGIKSPEIVTSLQAQEGQRIANTTNQFGLLAGQNKYVMDAIGTAASNPNITKDKVVDLVTRAARNSNIPSRMFNSWLNAAPNDPAKLKEFLVQTGNAAIGSAPTSGRVEGPIVEGVPQRLSQGQANYATVGVGPTDPNAPIQPKSVTTVPVRPGYGVELAPGEKTLMEGPAKRADALQSTAATSPQYHADLDNLKQDSKVLGNLAGPTIETEKKLNQFSQRLKSGFGITMAPDELRAAESFDKIANQIAQNQIKVMSDSGLATSANANPSIQMSKLGRDGVIDMLQGNQDAIDTARKEWLKARKLGAPAASHDNFMQDLTNGGLDVRVFQFNRLNRDAQQKFLQEMDAADIPSFEQKYRGAIQRGWVKPLKAPSNG